MAATGIIDPNRVYDGWSDLSGGVDGGRFPDLIENNQCAEAENVVFRGGSPTTRPGYRDMEHVFYPPYIYYTPTGELTELTIGQPSVSSPVAFKTKKFQCAHYYSPSNQPASIMASIGGRLFQIFPKTNGKIEIREHVAQNQIAKRLTPPTIFAPSGLPTSVLRNAERFPIAYMCQADRYMILQDGESKPIIFDGVLARRAEDWEVPVGTIMAYGQGRLVVVRGQNIFFGDLYGSHATVTAGEAVLRFEETTYLNEGFPAAISTSFGEITAAFFTPQQDSATGDGELLVSAERGISSFFVSQPRDQWKESAFQRITLQSTGVRGHRSPVPKNGDVWFRAQDGIRSYRQARSEINGWAHFPLSTNVRKWIDADTLPQLKYSSSVPHDGRIFFTCTPVPNQGRPYHNGLLSIDFDVLSTFGQASKPAWDGHHTGMKVTQVVVGDFNGDERAFAFAIDDYDENHIYEITHSDPHDFSGAITASVTGRSMSFKAENGAEMPFNEKELYQADIWVSNVTDTPVTPSMSYRPDQHPGQGPCSGFIEWGDFETVSPVGTCGDVNCGSVPTKKAGFYPRLQLGKPPDECDDDHTNRFFRRGYEFQPKLTWTGHASIRKLRLHAQKKTETPQAQCNT